jgi:ABC-type nitrate/sulfonate/bicarbonate transport system ATPase subunit
VFLSDRVAMMTSGPDATLGGVLEVPFARPRDRRQVFEDETFEGLREQLLGFLEDQAQQPVSSEKAAALARPGFLGTVQQAVS